MHTSKARTLTAHRQLSAWLFTLNTRPSIESACTDMCILNIHMRWLAPSYTHTYMRAHTRHVGRHAARSNTQWIHIRFKDFTYTSSIHTVHIHHSTLTYPLSVHSPRTSAYTQPFNTQHSLNKGHAQHWHTLSHTLHTQPALTLSPQTYLGRFIQAASHASVCIRRLKWPFN